MRDALTDFGKIENPRYYYVRVHFSAVTFAGSFPCLKPPRTEDLPSILVVLLSNLADKGVS